MLATIRLVFAPLVSLFVFTLGYGLLMTLLTVRFNLEGQSAFVIGGLSAAFYAGLVLGSFRIERLIARVGHIRAFAALAASLSVLYLMQGIYVIPWFWLVARFIGGIFTAGIFVVVESWLLAGSTASMRGRILSLYMIALYAAQASGQLFLGVSDPMTLVPFCLATILCTLSIVPLAMTYIESPRVDEPSALNFVQLYKVSPSGMLGSFSSGLVLGAIYGLLPLFIGRAGMPVSEIAWLMAIVIFGGMFFQYPLGRLSDVLGRRKVMIGVTCTTLVCSILVALTVKLYWVFAILLFIFGGLTFVWYPLSISHACDSLEAKDVVAATQGLLLSYSVGASAGPLIAPLFIRGLGNNGLFVYFALVSTLISLFFIWRGTQSPALPVESQNEYRSLPQTTPIATELDPRGTEGQG